MSPPSSVDDGGDQAATSSTEPRRLPGVRSGCVSLRAAAAILGHSSIRPFPRERQAACCNFVAGPACPNGLFGTGHETDGVLRLDNSRVYKVRPEPAANHPCKSAV